jgi:hypothetical protein
LIIVGWGKGPSILLIFIRSSARQHRWRSFPVTGEGRMLTRAIDAHLLIHALADRPLAVGGAARAQSKGRSVLGGCAGGTCGFAIAMLVYPSGGWA